MSDADDREVSVLLTVNEKLDRLIGEVNQLRGVGMGMLVALTGIFVVFLGMWLQR